MNLLKFSSAVVASAVVLGWTPPAFAERFDFQFIGEPGSFIRFTGGPERSMVFPGDFKVVGSTKDLLSPPGNSLVGSISGTFTLGTVVTYPGGFQVAPISGLGSLSIIDGDGKSLSAKLSFAEVFWYKGTLGVEFGNTPNVTDFFYNGLNEGLARVSISGATSSPVSPVINISARFSDATVALSSMMEPGQINQTAYAGFFTSMVPEPSTYAMFAVGLTMVGFSLARGRKQ